MIGMLQQLGGSTLATAATLGRAVLFLLRVLRGSGELVRRPGLLVREMYSVGVLTLVIIIVSGLFVGMVLALSLVHI